MSKSSDLDWCVYENWQPCNCLRMPETNRFSGEPDAGKSACPVRRGESGSHRKVSPSLLLYRESVPPSFEFRSKRRPAKINAMSRKAAKLAKGQNLGPTIPKRYADHVTCYKLRLAHGNLRDEFSDLVVLEPRASGLGSVAHFLKLSKSVSSMLSKKLRIPLWSKTWES